MRKSIGTVIFIFLCFSGFAQDISANEETLSIVQTEEHFSGNITEIHISGLKRTKESYVQNVLADFKDVPADKVNLRHVEAVLHSQGLFSEIDVKKNPSEDGQNTVLKIDVKEKITFIPLPFISYSSDGFMGGLMLMDMNFLGRKNTLVTGGIFSSSMQMAMMAFSKPAVDIKHPGFSSYIGFNHRDEKFEDFDENTVYDLNRIGFQAQFTIHEKLTKNLTVSLGGKYLLSDIFDSDFGFYNSWFGTSGISWQTTSFNGWFLNNSGASVVCELGYADDGRFIQSYKGSATYETQFIIPRLRLHLNASAIWEDGKNVTEMANKVSIGATILRTKYKSSFLSGVNLNFEGAILKIKMLTLSLYGTYEANVSKDMDDSYKFCHGPGAGMKVYMSKVAFPACLIGTSYNVTADRWNFVFSIGMGF